MLNTDDMDAAVILQKLEELKSIAVIQTKDALTVKEAACFTGLSKSYLWKLCQGNKIPHYRTKEGTMIYFKKDELTRWLLYSRVGTAEEITSKARNKAFLGN